MTTQGIGNQGRQVQLVVEIGLITTLLASTLFTLFVEPGIPAARPWLLPLGLVAMASGLMGVIARRRGSDRLAGAFYVVASLSPNGLYFLNLIVFAMGAVSLAGLKLSPPGREQSATRQG